MNFVQTTSVTENLIPISEITMSGKGNVQCKNEKFCMFDFD